MLQKDFPMSMMAEALILYRKGIQQYSWLLCEVPFCREGERKKGKKKNTHNMYVRAYKHHDDSDKTGGVPHGQRWSRVGSVPHSNCKLLVLRLVSRC